ncbi:lipopolysaccharide biosynthesis protein [Methylophaga sp.]|jgi:PST family polysaccharide transporter|uniref:lipopolysaccharide biosynthesis protein n=1 Tax=Methylophaga sp. TaxID=2024840 RepID=UPI0014006792|nr:lipopolysaccharide biosynthesis protein [Methylophaga sp.]MTI62585.1 lipopolysaccharide biosynthesis protein [Methylophaga sp.]
MGLASKAARGGVVMMSGQMGKVVLQLLNLIILARLLKPESFGLVAMIVALFGIGEIIRDCGLSTAAIQAKTLTQKQASNLFWANLLIGALLTLTAYFLAQLIADFYGRVELVEIAQFLSLIFLLNGAASQFKAKLNRDLKFGFLVTVELLGTLIGIGAGIYLAYSGYSYMAIVYQQIVQAFMFLLLYSLLARWRPSLPQRDEGTKQLFSFGWNLMGAQMLGYFSKNMPVVLIGYKFGATPLGYFERAMQILMMPLNQLSAPSQAVAVPILSKLQLDDEAKYNQFLVFGQNIIVHLITFGLMLIATQTERLVTLVLGAQWVELVPIFQALSLGGVFLVLGYSSYWVFLSKGITNRLLKLSLITRPLIIAITAAGLVGNTATVALCYSLGLGCSWLLGMYWLKNTGIPVRRMLLNPMMVALVYFFAAFVSHQLISLFQLGLLEGVLYGWLVFFLLLAVAYGLLPSFRISVNQLFQLRNYLNKGKQA